MKRSLVRTREALATRVALHEQTELELVRSEERFRLAQGAARVGIYDLDVMTGTSTWSESLREIYGVDDADPAGYEEFLALVDARDRDGVREAVESALSTGAAFESEYRLCRPDGEVRWLFSRGRAFVDEHGRPARVMGAAMDITERKSAEGERASLEQQLRQGHKLEAVGRLAAGVAHDFNNLLFAIRGYGELAGSLLEAGEDAREEVAEIVRVADRAALLTRQLLAFSRRQVLQPEVLGLNDVVADMERLLKRMIGEDVGLDTVLAEEEVFVDGDRGQLEQVLVNLVVNAGDAMPLGGRVKLEVGSAIVGANQGLDLPPGRFALLAVSDTGCGMSPDTAARVFEPYFTTKSEGTGLGLATVKGIVQHGGGTISLDSEAGVGTTFKIYLPVACELAPVGRAAVAAA
ncbi:MAG: hypothetical protein QOJ43_1631 [Gaiellaceae bacterium]|jgi:PAS domain S-box-containing protein|nr:hypothetical protein [Gaiellaceae bacterium]